MRKPGYKQLHTLHLHEERVVLALLIERGSGSTSRWDQLEPGRWDQPYLSRTFRRLRVKRLVHATRINMFAVTEYTPRDELKFDSTQRRNHARINAA